MLLGEGIGNLKALFLEMERHHQTGLHDARHRDRCQRSGDLFKAVDAFEAVVQPA